MVVAIAMSPGCFGGSRIIRGCIWPMPVRDPDFAISPIQQPAIWAADPFIGREQALDIALDAETASQDYYQSVFDATTDPEIKVLAGEFAEEESEHVAELLKWIAAHKSGRPWPVSQ